MTAKAAVDELVDHDLPPAAGDILFYQTAAGSIYEQMVRATETLHRRYCAVNGLDYHTEFGVRRGRFPWQATFNRVEMLGDLLTANFRGWFVYLDADAVIHQLGFDLRRYLGKRKRCAMIAAPGGAERWNVNAGILFLNFDDPVGREIAVRWRNATHTVVSEQMLQAAATPWQPLPNGLEFPDDQHLLQMELLRDAELADRVLLEKSGLLSSSNGRFISQYMRVLGSPLDRLTLIQEAVAKTCSV
ncbi:hypothetical protein ACSBM8_05100 [Sphingomonas sp. ASY06-1R]|jgi:hypothetical protein|uniref:hypothetical protein n=1 Tax=Sphingomonas sp. ASY06-1R TaxID=3445771 RepID=UPI003FA28F1D